MSEKYSTTGRHDRRSFLKAGGAVTAALLAPTSLAADTPKPMPPLPVNPVTPAAMPTRNLGRTGYKVGIFSLGGQAALEKQSNFDLAVPIIERSLPCHQDQRAHPRRFHAHDREVAATASDRPR